MLTNTPEVPRNMPSSEFWGILAGISPGRRAERRPKILDMIKTTPDTGSDVIVPLTDEDRVIAMTDPELGYILWRMEVTNGQAYCMGVQDYQMGEAQDLRGMSGSGNAGYQEGWADARENDQ